MLKTDRGANRTLFVRRRYRSPEYSNSFQKSDADWVHLLRPEKADGGTPAVQDTSLSEVFFRPDPYADVVLKSNYPTVRVEGKSVQISALKQSEDGTDLVLRFYNYGSQEETVKVRAKGGIYQSNMAEDKKEFIGTDHVKLSVNPKQIITLRIEK